MHKPMGQVCDLTSPQMSLLLETPDGLRGLDPAGRRAVVELVAQLLQEAIRSLDEELVGDDQA